MGNKSKYQAFIKNPSNHQVTPMETVDNSYPDREYLVKFTIPEFSCVCPKTGLPDFATIRIEYVPAKLLVELKSLKFYINSFRNIGIFHESVANRILDDLVKATKPRRAKLEADFNVRGGIHTVVEAQYRWK